ncbi:MAG: DUF4402 domain-containing protein [Alphaproteobacteria bacterium]|nr:DUF4402 domain-containing protein [Alphaproteobacteria bacterium]
MISGTANATTDYAEVTAKATIEVAGTIDCTDLNFGTIVMKQNNKDSVLTLDYNNVDEEVTSTLTEDLLSVSNASVAVCRMEDPTKFKIPTSVILTGANGSMTVSLTTQDTGTTASRILGSLSIPTDVKAGEYTGSFIVTYTY